MMQIRKIISFGCIVFALLISGCASLQLREANQDLTELYRAKTEAVNSGRWQQEISVDAALSALAKEAAAEGAKSRNPELNRISYYRIAATAAWQAEDPEVLIYADNGMALCTTENSRKVPRDCAMLSVIPGFASVDELTKKINDINRRINATANPSTEQEVADVLSSISQRVGALLRNREKIKQSDTDPKLIAEIDRQLGDILCLHFNSLRGQAIEIAGNRSTVFKNAQCEEYKVMLEFRDLGISPRIAPCLPPGEIADPGGCN